MNCIKRRYCADLDAAAKQRYDDILPGLVDDLYITPFVPGQRQLWPEIDTFSPYKAKGLHKSGWVYFSIQGWVRNIRILSLGEVSLLLADVKHSQKLTATPLHPWIVVAWPRLTPG